MRKVSKKLLMLALTTLFVGAGFGVAKTMNVDNVNIAVAEETTAPVSLDNTFSATLEGASYFADEKYSMSRVYLASSVAFSQSGVYLNDHGPQFPESNQDHL